MTSRAPTRLRFGRTIYRFALIAGAVLLAGMLASLVWNVLWPVWADPHASEEKWRMAVGVSAMVAINGGLAAVGLVVIGWIIRFALTRERALWPGRRAGEE